VAIFVRLSFAQNETYSFSFNAVIEAIKITTKSGIQFWNVTPHTVKPSDKKRKYALLARLTPPRRTPVSRYHLASEPKADNRFNFYLAK